MFATIGDIISRIDGTLFFASAIQVLVLLYLHLRLAANSGKIFNDKIYCKSPQEYNGKFS